MLFSNCIEKLTGLQDIEVKNIENTDNEIHIYCQLKRKPHKFICCNTLTDTIHDYREQIIKDIPAFGKNCFINLKKRRYRCSCGKRFAENNSFPPRYHRMTNRLSAYIVNRTQFCFLNEKQTLLNQYLNRFPTFFNKYRKSYLSYIKFIVKSNIMLIQYLMNPCYPFLKSH